MGKFLNLMRQGKHCLFLANKNKYKIVDAGFSVLSRARNYRYSLDRYQTRTGGVIFPSSSTFIVNHLRFPTAGHPVAYRDREAPKVIYVAWLGDNPMTPSRVESLEAIRKANPDFEIVLVTGENYQDFIVPEHPFHPSYQDLTYIQQSDYLRAYLMYHHGGVYTDIKMLSKPWKEVVDKLNQSDKWLAGPHELSYKNVSPATGSLGRDQRIHWKEIVWQSAFAFKPGTPLAQEWLEEAERRLDYFSKLLATNKTEDKIWGLDGKYPVPWLALTGQILSPLCLKYRDKILIDREMKFVVNRAGYR